MKAGGRYHVVDFGIGITPGETRAGGFSAAMVAAEVIQEINEAIGQVEATPL